MPPSLNALFWLRTLRVSAWLLALALPIYWAASYSGLYRLLAELQIWIFGAHMTLVSFILPLLILLFPSIYLTARIDKLATQGLSASQTTEYYRKTYIGDLQKSARFQQRLQRNFWLVLCCVMLIIGGGTGVYFLVQAHRAGTLEFLTIDQLHSDRVRNHHIEVNGFLHPQYAVGIKATSRNSTAMHYFYLPLTAEPALLKEKPVHVIVKVSGKGRFADLKKLAMNNDRISIRGMLSHSIDGLALDRLRNNGVRIADHAWVLEDGESPEHYQTLGTGFLIGFGGLGVLGIAIILFRRSLNRRSSSR